MRATLIVIALAGCSGGSTATRDGGGGFEGGAGVSGQGGTGGAGTGGAGGVAGTGPGGAGGGAGVTGTGGGGAGGGAGVTGTGGGGAGGGGGVTGSGGAVQYACLEVGGTCTRDCTTSCQPGYQMVTLACGPISESNAVCGGGHCCLPIPTSYACGSQTCVSGQSFCYSFSGGVPGSGTSRSCMSATSVPACAGNLTCACVCPPSTIGGGGGCTFNGGTASCYCSETYGLTVTCLGQ